MDDGVGGLVDCGVGTIVWVRRRNGSWWPGKILGSDELSASHLMSPRSGTPVKLLGREDASVDWYNLEKSKRVKPFRCGEFDDCIHRAEASQGMPPKKREKYARREDAILHALDLEKQLLHKNKNPIQDNTNPPLYLYHQHQQNLDDKRFPLPFNYKHSSSNGKHAVDDDYDYDDDDEEEDDDDDDDDDDGVTLETMIHVGMLEKRKRTQDGNMDELVSKRRDRRRPLVHLLNTSPKLPLQIQEGEDQQKQIVHPPPMLNYQVEPKFDVGLSEDNNTTGSNEDTETDSSGTESLLSDTYDALSDEGEDIQFIPKTFGRSIAHEEVESMSEDESGVGDESGDSLPSSVTVSKWQLKGKRNSRRYPERNMHWNSFKGGEETSYFDKNNMRSQAAMVGQDIINWEVEQQPPSTSLQGGVGYWVVDPSPSAMYGGSSSSRQFGGRIKSMLIEVEVQVQSGYQREHVPMISLMSKLNDNAIVGHPIPIETLEDGSSDNIILSAADDDESLLLLGDGGGDSTIQPWTTARRTTKCRVPRPPHLSTLEEEEEEEEEEEASYDEYVVEETNRKGRKLVKKPQKKTSSSSCNQKIRTLSSIGGSGIQQQLQNIDLKSQCYKGGEMKPESLPTAVACIPVKLVFSRLHEELVARHQ